MFKDNLNMQLTKLDVQESNKSENQDFINSYSRKILSFPIIPVKLYMKSQQLFTTSHPTHHLKLKPAFKVERPYKFQTEVKQIESVESQIQKLQIFKQKHKEWTHRTNYEQKMKFN